MIPLFSTRGMKFFKQLQQKQYTYAICTHQSTDQYNKREQHNGT